jgi:hypothetical protein
MGLTQSLEDKEIIFKVLDDVYERGYVQSMNAPATTRMKALMQVNLKHFLTKKAMKAPQE